MQNKNPFVPHSYCFSTPANEAGELPFGFSVGGGWAPIVLLVLQIQIYRDVCGSARILAGLGGYVYATVAAQALFTLVKSPLHSHLHSIAHVSLAFLHRICVITSMAFKCIG